MRTRKLVATAVLIPLILAVFPKITFSAPIEIDAINVSSFLIVDAEQGLACSVQDSTENIFGRIKEPRILELGAVFNKKNPAKQKNKWLACLDDGRKDCAKHHKRWKTWKKFRKQCNAYSVADLPKPETPGPGATPCSLPTETESEDLEKQLDSSLAQFISDTDFTYAIERADGRAYVYSSASSSLQTLYKSASTSKLVSAVIILRLVDQGYLALADRPQDHITTWPLAGSELSEDPLKNITLANLLSFTSGLTVEPPCLDMPGANFEDCVNDIAAHNLGNGSVPGEEFYYSPNHLQVAGMMAIKALGYESWQDVFSAFRSQTGLFQNSTYDLPSLSNPRLAGGMHWIAEDYRSFLRAFANGSLLSPALQTQALKDQTASAKMAYSPVFVALGEDWHYGFGLWLECQSPEFNCAAAGRKSSPGAYGAYPFWDTARDYFGLLARQGALGTFQNGYAIDYSVRSLAEAWATCK